MLFLKRLSDRFDEEVEIAVASGVPQAAAVNDPDEHQFAVPETAHWSRIVKATMSLGEALNVASQRLLCRHLRQAATSGLAIQR